MSRKIRVAMLGTYPVNSANIRGGVQAAYAYLVKGLLQQDDLDIHILTFGSRVSLEIGQVEQANLTFHFLHSYSHLERLRNYRTYQSIINSKLGQIQPDVVHAQDAAEDALVALRSGFPTVITVHGIRWEDGKHYRSLNRRLHTFFDSLVTERYVMRHASHLIAISQYVTDYFKDLLRPDIQIYYIPNAIDDRFFNLAKQPGKPVVLFAGRVIRRKRVIDLVRSFAKVHTQLPDAHLHIAGDTHTEPAYVEAIRQWISQSKLHDHVHFLGNLPEETIFQEFLNCSVLVLPSAQETAPMVIAQAMAAGKPVVATRVGGVGEMVGEDCSRGFLFNIGDIDGLAIAVTRLLQNPDLQIMMGQKGRAFAQENYHLENVARRTHEVYQHIALKEQRAIA